MRIQSRVDRPILGFGSSPGRSATAVAVSGMKMGVGKLSAVAPAKYGSHHVDLVDPV